MKRDYNEAFPNAIHTGALSDILASKAMKINDSTSRIIYNSGEQYKIQENLNFNNFGDPQDLPEDILRKANEIEDHETGDEGDLSQTSEHIEPENNHPNLRKIFRRKARPINSQDSQIVVQGTSIEDKLRCLKTAHLESLCRENLIPVSSPLYNLLSKSFENLLTSSHEIEQEGLIRERAKCTILKKAFKIQKQNIERKNIEIAQGNYRIDYLKSQLSRTTLELEFVKDMISKQLPYLMEGSYSNSPGFDPSDPGVY